MGAPRVPPLNPSESIVLWEHYRLWGVKRNGGHKWVKSLASLGITFVVLVQVYVTNKILSEIQYNTIQMYKPSTIRAQQWNHLMKMFWTNFANYKGYLYLLSYIKLFWCDNTIVFIYLLLENIYVPFCFFILDSYNFIFTSKLLRNLAIPSQGASECLFLSSSDLKSLFEEKLY